MPKYRIKVEDVSNPQSVKTVYTHEVEADVDKLRAFAVGVRIQGQVERILTGMHREPRVVRGTGEILARSSAGSGAGFA